MNSKILLDPCTMTEDELVAFSSGPDCETLYAPEGSSKRLIKLTDQITMKYGDYIQQDEAIVQLLAYHLLDPEIIRVPQVYRFFTRGDRGYIIMEYIHGQAIEKPEDSNQIERVAAAFRHMASIQCPIPGPLAGGTLGGLLWAGGTELSLKITNIRDLEWFFNRRLRDKKVCLHDSPLVLCHLDIAPRNILWLDDGALCLLDWEAAGFYPRMFEVLPLRINWGAHGEFEKLVLAAMKPLTEEEEAQWELCGEAWSREQRFYFKPQPPPPPWVSACSGGFLDLVSDPLDEIPSEANSDWSISDERARALKNSIDLKCGGANSYTCRVLGSISILDSKDSAPCVEPENPSTYDWILLTITIYNIWILGNRPIHSSTSHSSGAYGD